MNNPAYKNGEQITYHLSNGVNGKGKVVGIAAHPTKETGFGYIIEDLSKNIPSTAYPYSHMIVFDSQIIKL